MKKIYLLILSVFFAGQIMAQSSFSTTSNSDVKQNTTVANDQGAIVKVKTIRDLDAFKSILAEMDVLTTSKQTSSRSAISSIDEKLAEVNVRYKALLTSESKNKNLSKEDRIIIKEELAKIK